MFNPLGMDDSSTPRARPRAPGGRPMTFLRTGRDLAKGKASRRWMGMDGNVVLGKVESMDWFIDDSDGDCIAGSGGIISSAHDRVSGPVYCVPSTLRKKLTSVSDQVGARAAGAQIPLTSIGSSTRSLAWTRSIGRRGSSGT